MDGWGTSFLPHLSQQQITNFNSLMVNFFVPMINTLHGMPSLSHLSSTQSELGNCNVHYSGFVTDLSTPASVDDQINTNDYSVTDPVIEKCSFQRNTICLPPDVAFQVHLLSQMNTHRGNEWNVFTLSMLKQFMDHCLSLRIMVLLGTMLPICSVPCHKGDGGNTLATRYNHKIILVDDTYWLYF